MNQWILKTGFLIGVFFLLLVGFMTETHAMEGRVRAEVNTVPITEKAVNVATRTYLTQIGHKRLSASRMLELKRKMLKGLIEEELLYQEGLKKEWIISEKEIEAGVKRIRDRFPSETDFLAAIEEEHLSLNDLRKGIRRFVLIRKTRESISRLPDGAQQERLQQITQNSSVKIHED
jgi:hypothetical protein